KEAGIAAKIHKTGRAAVGRQDVRAPRIGDRVRLLSFGSIGIVDQLKDDEAEVRVGSLHVREKLANLEPIDNEPGSSPTNRGPHAGSPRGVVAREGSESANTRGRLRAAAQTTELHLHSKSADELKANAELNLIGRKTDEAVE